MNGKSQPDFLIGEESVQDDKKTLRQKERVGQISLTRWDAHFAKKTLCEPSTE
jgi:hypothetical protein